MVCNIKVIMEEPEIYINLKNNFFETVGDQYDLQIIKEYFKDIIDSPRTLSRIKSLKNVVEVLEDLDVLSYRCPSSLLYLGRDVLKNSKVTTLVTIYKKYYVSESDLYCSCGIKLIYIEPPLPLQSGRNGLKFNSGSRNSSNSDLEEAMKIIATRIGKYWRVLASELDVRESQIDFIYKKFPDDKQKQAYEALVFWLADNKENATIERLDKALNSRLCKRVGLGTDIRIRVAGMS